MNRQQIREELSKAEETQKAASESIARLTKLLNEPEGVWRPEINDFYFRVDGFARLDRQRFLCQLDKEAFAIGNCFPTKEAAELHVKRLKVIQKLRELAGGFKTDFREVGVMFYRVSYDRGLKKWVARRTFHYSQIVDIPFATLEQAQAAITTLGDELNVLLEG